MVSNATAKCFASSGFSESTVLQNQFVLQNQLVLQNSTIFYLIIFDVVKFIFPTIKTHIFWI